jgi:monofunctional biosynthetic peptidoglycan transglycosylase
MAANRLYRFVLPTVLTLLAMDSHASTRHVMFDFKAESTTPGWAVVNDDVMGGVSTSTFLTAKEGHAVFKGNLSLDNNGGFASVRTISTLPRIEDADTFVVRVKGDGRTYRLTAKMSDDWNSPMYHAPFSTSAEEWQEIELGLSAFKASFRGRPLPDEPPLDLSRIKSIGLMLADKQPGSFKLEIQSISTKPAKP